MLSCKLADELTTDPADELVGWVSCRPDRAVLCYPVTSLCQPDDPPLMHDAYRILLGPCSHDASLRKQLSASEQLDGRSPPLFIWATAEDPLVPCQHSISLFTAARASGVSAELHLYAGEATSGGKHAQGLATENSALRGWSEQMLRWLEASWAARSSC